MKIRLSFKEKQKLDPQMILNYILVLFLGVGIGYKISKVHFSHQRFLLQETIISQNKNIDDLYDQMNELTNENRRAHQLLKDMVDGKK